MSVVGCGRSTKSDGRRYGSSLLAALATVVFATGCETRVETSIAVDDDDVALTAAVAFDGAVAEILETDEVLREQLEDTLAANFGDVRVVEPGVRYEVRFTEVDVATHVGLTGIRSVDVRRGDGTATVTVAMERPQRLVDAVTMAVADMPDGAPMAATIATAVTVAVTVTFPGSVSAVDGFTVDGSKVRFAATLADLDAPRTLVATGATTTDTDRTRWLVAAAVLAVLGYGAVRAGRDGGRR